MNLPSLPAKLLRPRPVKVLPRERLFALLDERARGRIGWITGPAGAGKTTLVSSYLESRGLAHLWLRLDPSDADPAAFFEHLALGVSHAKPGTPTLPPFTAEYFAEPTPYVREFFRRLFGALGGGVLVLDDMHEVSDAGFHRLLAVGMGEVPPDVSVLVTSRGAPPQEWVRLRVNGALAVIGQEAMRLNLEESAALARSREPARASDDAAIARLHKRTEGWPAGFILLLDGATGDRPASADETVVFDFFAGEVMAGGGAAWRQFLLQVALLPSMTAKAAEALTGNRAAGQILADLHRRGHFTTRHQDGDGVVRYQFHQLFRDFLRERQARVLPGGELVELKRKAAALLAGEGESDAAAELLVDAADWCGLAQLIGTHALQLMAAGRYRRLLSLIAHLPEPILDGAPNLLLLRGAAQLPFGTVEARISFERAFARSRALGDVRGSYLGWSAVIESYVFEMNDFHPLAEWIHRFHELQQEWQFPDAECEIRATSAIVSALLYHATQDPELPVWAERLERLLSEMHEARSRLSAGHQLLLYYSWVRGDMGKANELVTALRNETPAGVATPLIQVAWAGVQAAHLWMNGDIEASASAVETGLAIAAESGARVWDGVLLTLGARTRVAMHDLDGATAYLDRIAALPRHGRTIDMFHYHFERFVVAYHRNDAQAMLREAELADSVAHCSGVPWICCVNENVMARALAVNGRWEEATAKLEHAFTLARTSCSNVSLFAGWLLRAEWELDKGHVGEALREALSLARRNGLVNLGTWHDPTMARLCAAALDHGIEVEYVRHLIRKRRLVPPIDPPSSVGWPWAVRVSTLGAFELAVDGRPEAQSGRSQKRLLALLKALVAAGHGGINAARLAEMLWPDSSPEAAYRALITTLMRVRQLLGVKEAIIHSDGVLALDARYVWVDAWIFDGPIDGSADEAELLRRLVLYRGPFLADEVDAWWATGTRQRLARRFREWVMRLGHDYSERGEWSKCAECYAGALEVDETAEDLCRGLMVALEHLHRPTEALVAYRRLCDALARCGTKPSAVLQAMSAALGER